MTENTNRNDARPILVPVDFSPHSLAALKWAAEASRRFEAPLILLHVVHDPGAAPGYYSQGTQDLRRMEDVATDILDSFLADARGAHPEIGRLENLKSMLVVGLPANRILEVAEKVDAGLIVMGSQGRTGLSRFLLGSKAERVVQLSPIPVTIVKAEPTDGSQEHAP